MLTKPARHPVPLPPRGALAERADGTWSGERTPGVTDADIIGLSLREPSRFDMIFERHAGEILRYAHARLGPDLAEEVLAETFLAAFGRRAHYDRSCPDARPWLYGIAIRQIGRHRRAEHRGRRTLARIPIA